MSHAGETAERSDSVSTPLLRPVALEWHETWSPTIDDAFDAMEYDHLMDVEFVRGLWNKGIGRDRQRIALVKAQGETVGIVPLRKRGKMSWQLLTQYTMPYARFFVLPEYTDAALDLLGDKIDCNNVLFSRMPARTRMLRPEESWIVPLTPSYAELMQQTKYVRKDRQCRQHAAGLTLTEDRYEDLPEALEHWQAKWIAQGSHATANRKSEVLEGFQIMAELGQLKTFSLYDKEQFVAMVVNMVGSDSLYFLLTIALDRYKPNYPGIRLLLASMEWGCTCGLREYDMLRTSGHYKSLWATPEIRGYRLVRRPFGSEVLGCAIESTKEVLWRIRHKE